MFLKFLIISVILSNVNVTSRKLSPRIINGFNAAEGQFPWNTFLILIVNNEEFGICGGTIISQNWILTAGHCVTRIQRVTIKMGSIYKKKFTQVRKSSVFHPHPKYKSKFDYDIALIKVNKPIKFTKTIRPIKLAKRSMSGKFLKGKICTVCGFGMSNRKLASNPSRLKYAKLRIISLETCKKKFRLYENSTDNTGMCGQELKRNQNVCVGDSGGGLIYYQKDTPYVVGVVSFGNAACRASPTAYQSVQKHLDWISKKTGIKV